MSDLIKCPFCDETGFDKVGLKYHFDAGYCEWYSNQYKHRYYLDVADDTGNWLIKIGDRRFDTGVNDVNERNKILQLIKFINE